MKTVVGTLLGVDRHLCFTGSTEPESLGSCHADQCVRYLLGLPQAEATPEEGCSPTLTLEGRRGMTMVFRRRQPGRLLQMTVTNGEQDLSIDEMQAVYRVRLFVEHHGEETEHTAEVRLSPEIRQAIMEKEGRLDEERHRRLKRESHRRVFRRRGLFKSYAIAVDRRANAVFEVRRGKDHEILDLEQMYRADVADLDETGGCRVVVELKDGTEDHPVGRVSWPQADAIEIAEALNDAIDLSETLRKLLQYRRVTESRDRRPGR